MNEKPAVQPQSPVETILASESVSTEEAFEDTGGHVILDASRSKSVAVVTAGAESDLAKIHGVEERLGIKLPQAVGEKETLTRDAVETHTMHPLENEEAVDRILLQGTDEELKALMAFHKFTSEQVKLFSHFVKLRRDTLADASDRFRARVMSAPEPTEEEWKLGVYREEIEPQVRDAVIMLRNKGYNTFESGFYGPDMQRIGFAESLGAEISPEALRQLESLGLRTEVTEDGINLHYSRPLGLDELKNAWDIVARDLPDLGHEAGKAVTGATEFFRKRVENIKRNPEAFFD